MKKKWLFFLVCVTLILCGCSKMSNPKGEKKRKDVVTHQVMHEKEQNTEKKQESVEDGEEQKQDPFLLTEAEGSKTNQTETSIKDAKKEETLKEEGQKTEPVLDVPPTTPEPTKPQEEETVEEKEEPPKEEPPSTNATASDCQKVADKVLDYINAYRSVPAMKLPGLTQYAEYRSRQLVKKLAHDTLDERVAATALQYGTYIDPTLYGITGEPYYAAGAREAIAKAGYAGSIDYVAKSIAELVKNSSSHWSYVGSAEYTYIAVGITYESGMWYCDIAVATENTDNK